MPARSSLAASAHPLPSTSLAFSKPSLHATVCLLNLWPDASRPLGKKQEFPLPSNFAFMALFTGSTVGTGNL
eukprot:scaffold78461_cov32-Prasinocladus_malaysianus.AAC.1